MLFKELADFYSRLEGVSSRLTMIDILTEALKSAGTEEAQKIIYMTEGILAPPFEGLDFGIAEKTAEDSIAMATGYTKDQVHSEYKKLGDMGLVAEKLVGATKLRRMRSSQYTVSQLYDTMLKISRTSGHGSKDTKIKMLADAIASSSPLEARYVVRYPLGELRLGAGDSTILEALSVVATGGRSIKAELEAAYNICSDLGLVGRAVKEGGADAIKHFKVDLFKPIRPALAERLPTAEQILERMHGRCAVEQKYDGFRCQIHKDGADVRIFSRRLENTTAMFPDIVKAVQREVKARRIIFEGEALAYNEATGEFMPFQETIQRKRKHGIKEKIEELPLHLMAFDVMYIDGKDYMHEPYEQRRKALEGVLSKDGIILPTKRIITSSAKELESFFESSVENGLEGIVAKDLQAEYIAGARKFSWIKLKRSYRGELSDTLDLVIVGYFLGRGARAELKFGGLLCAVYNEKRDMFETVSRLGTGFTEKQMTELKELLDKAKSKPKPARVDSLIEPDFWVYPKYVVTVKADEITRSPMHTCGRSKSESGEETGYALRFPRLVGEEAVRSDKSVEEATTTKEVEEMFRQQRKVRVVDNPS